MRELDSAIIESIAAPGQLAALRDRTNVLQQREEQAGLWLTRCISSAMLVAIAVLRVENGYWALRLGRGWSTRHLSRT